MQERKKQLEILLANYFRQIFKDFPKCKIVPSESPDFFLKLSAKKQIGLELTSVNPTVAFTCMDDKHVHELRERIILLSKELFGNHSMFPVFVKILFSESKPIIPERELAVSAKLAIRILKTVENKNSRSFFVRSVPHSQLPEGVEGVLVVHHPALKESVWEAANNLGVSDNVLEDIISAIEKKERKLPLYQKQKTEANWLLITSDRLRGKRSYSIKNQIIKQRFDSQFDCIFLFDLLKGEVFKLV